jgi:hypothetical protein
MERFDRASTPPPSFSPWVPFGEPRIPDTLDILRSGAYSRPKSELNPKTVASADYSVV